jgi:oligoribonuclease NrnB/cAMP/cGMP phosphodiesterase (DHH superfamily)
MKYPGATASGDIRKNMAEAKTVIIYHKNCDDGFGAAYAAWLKYKDAAIYMPINYGDKYDVGSLAGKDIIIADFSFSPEVTLGTLARVGKSVTILDHHKSSMDEWANDSKTKSIAIRSPDELFYRDPSSNVSVFFSMVKSGALLAWEYFHPEKHVPKLISHISDADLFQFKDPETKSFKMYLRSLKMGFEEWEAVDLRSSNKEGHANMCDTGSHIRSYYDGLVNKQVNSRKVKEITLTVEVPEGTFTWKGLSANASLAFGTDLGNQLANKSGSFGLIWETDGTTCFCSIRSVEGFNCIPIAQKYGGGGHPRASGFSMLLTEMQKLLTE